MPAKIFFSYLLIEALTFYGVANWLGVGWALLILIGCFFGGLFLAAFEMRSIATTLLRGGTSPGKAAGDLGLVGSGSLLVAIPGIFTSIVGLLLIFPPTRQVVRKSLSKKARVKMENFGVRSFQRAAAYRPKSQFGSFKADGTSANEGETSEEERERLEEEIRQWSEQLNPEDFDDASGKGAADK